MVGVNCAMNAAAPLVFVDGVDVTLILEPIAGWDLS